MAEGWSVALGASVHQKVSLHQFRGGASVGGDASRGPWDLGQNLNREIRDRNMARNSERKKISEDSIKV